MNERKTKDNGGAEELEKLYTNTLLSPNEKPTLDLQKRTIKNEDDIKLLKEQLEMIAVEIDRIGKIVERIDLYIESLPKP